LRFAKVMSLIKPGDYFFMQFNHNDHYPLILLRRIQAKVTA
jgi:hypothetical protein